MEKNRKSMSAVAESLGVSRCTVSLVLSGRDREARIRPETAERIRDAFKKAKEMMKGNKWRLFKLNFSFIGWFVLCVLTFGVGTFFLMPYI